MNGNLSVYSTNLPSPHSYTPFSLDHNTSDSSEIQCICGFHHDDGFTIACDQCDTWQHGYCVDIAHDTVPEKYECPNCRPHPVDIRRAREYQQSYLEDRDREEKPRRKKPKSTSTSNPSRKKDASGNGMQSNGPGPPVLTDRASGSGKTNASRESTSSRKRGSNRASVATKAEPNLNCPPEPVNGAFATPVGAVISNAPSPTMTVATDRNCEDESDTDMEKPQLYFTDITDGKDHYASKEVRTFVNRMLNSPLDENVRWLTSEGVASVLPGLSVNSHPGNSNTYSLPQHFITVDNQCQNGQLVALCKGEIKFKESYKADAINQYSILRHPKPCVFFHPSQPICIDSRIHGSLARFVKRSCRPNTALATIVVDGAEVVFGLFATETVSAESTLTIGWEWSGSRAVQKLLQGAETEDLDHEEYKEALCWVNTLTSQMGECACAEKDQCIFTKLKVKRESSPPKSISRTRRGSRATQGRSSTPGSNQGSPERQITSDREDGSSSSKSRSRDLSPQLQSEGLMSSRDARKLQGLLSRFEKIEQGDQSAVNKRRKRSNTVSASAPTPDTIVKAEAARKSNSSSTAVSPPPLQDGRDVTLPTRKSSDSISVMSDESRTQMQPPPAPIKRIKKPDYVDCAMQTDDCDDAWWSAPAPDTLPCPTRVSLRERLMQCMLREREKAAAMGSRKRKQSEISDSSPSPTASCKEQKLVQECAAKVASQRTPAQMDTTDIPMDDGPRELVNTPSEPSDDTPMTSVSPSDVKPLEPVLSAQSRGPALAETFADSSPTAIFPQEPVMDDKRTPPVSPKSTTVDLPCTPPPTAGRTVRLQVHLPAGPAFPTAPATPSPMPTLTSSPPPATPGGQSQSPSIFSATDTNFPASVLSAISSQASHMNSLSAPAKTKKLSLSEYGRRKKVDHNDKKVMMSAVTEEGSINRGGPDATSPTTST